MKKEVFDHLRSIEATDDNPIAYEDFFKIRHEISIAAASNWELRDEDGVEFWTYIDSLLEKRIATAIYISMDESFQTQLEDEQTEEEVLGLNDNAYMKYVYFVSDADLETLKEVSEEMLEEFHAEVLQQDEPRIPKEESQTLWCITWD